MARKTGLFNPSIECVNQKGRHWAGLVGKIAVEYGTEQFRIDPCVFCVVVDGKVKLNMAIHENDIANSFSGVNEENYIIYSRITEFVYRWCVQTRLGIWGRRTLHRRRLLKVCVIAQTHCLTSPRSTG